MITLSGCTWTFHVRNLQPIDEGYYSCYVYRSTPGVENEYSNAPRLVVGPIDTTVTPSQIDRYVGQQNEVTMETYTGEMSTPRSKMITSVLLTTSGLLN